MGNSKTYPLSFIRDIHNKMEDNKLSLVYQGTFSQEITRAFISMTEHSMNKMEEEKSVKKKVFNVMVECLQNICKHSSEYEIKGIEESSIFVVGLENDEYFICSGNHIFNEEVEKLVAMLEQVNAMDKEELKAYYKMIIKDGKISSKGGAGLGLIDMARKSGEKMEYSFDQIDDRLSFFTLQVKVKRKKEVKE